MTYNPFIESLDSWEEERRKQLEDQYNSNVRNSRNFTPSNDSQDINNLADELFVDPQPQEQPRSFWQKFGDAISTMQGNDTGATEPPPFQLPAEAQGPFSVNHPILAQGLYQAGQPIRDFMDLPWNQRTSQAGAETMTMVDNPQKVDTGSRFGNVSADLVGGLMGFMPNPASAGAGVFGGAERLIGESLPLIPRAIPEILQTGLKLGGASIPYEAANSIANDRPFNPGEAGMAAGQNALLGMLLHGGGKALEAFRKPGEVAGIESPLTPEKPSVEATAPRRDFSTPTQDYIINNARDFVGGRDFSGRTDWQIPSNYLNAPARSGGTAYTQPRFSPVDAMNARDELYGAAGVKREPGSFATGKGLPGVSKDAVGNTPDFTNPQINYGGENYSLRELDYFAGQTESELGKMVDDMARYLRKQYTGASKETQDLYQQIVKRGGIAPPRSDSFAGEYRESVPLALKNKNGIPLDEMASEFGMSAADLLNGLNWRKSVAVGKVEYFRPQAEQVLADNPDYQQLVKARDNINALRGRILTGKGQPGQQDSFSTVGRNNFQVDKTTGQPMPQQQQPQRIPGPMPPKPFERQGQGFVKPQRTVGGTTPLEATSPPLIPGPVPQVNPAIPVRGPLPQGISPMSMQPPDTLGTIVSKSDRGPIDVNRIIRQAYTKTVDTQNRLNDVDKYVSSTTGRSLPPQDKLYMNAMNQKGSDQTARYILEEGMVDAKGNAAGPSFKEVVKAVPSGKWREFEDYLKLNNFKAWEAEGKTVYDKNLNMNEIFADRKIADYEAKYPWMKQASQNYTGWINQFGEKWLVDTGLVSRDSWNAMRAKYKDYIPFQRLMDETEIGVGTGRAKGAFAEQPNPVKKSSGSERKTIESVETMIERIPAYVKAAKRNKVMQKLIGNMQRDPQGMAPWGEIVTADTAHLTMPNVVAGRINGERVYVKVEDPQLLEALTKLSPTGQNTVVEAVRQVTRTMKVLTTGVNPMFSLARNIFRDLPTSYIASKSTNNPITWGRDILGSVVDILGNKDIYKSFKAMGGGHSSSIAADRNILAESKARIMPGYINPKKPLQATGRLGQKAFGSLERLANVTETVPRLAEYRRIVRQGGGSYDSKVKGLFEANDLTVNFNRSGQVSKDLDAFIPYLNAAVQGLDKFARIYKDNPVQAIAKSVAAVTIPTIVMYAVNHNDPDYNRLANWVKDNNFLIPKGDGTFIKIPKPREVGVVFGSSVERAMRQWAQGDPKGFEDFSQTIKTNFAPPVRTIAAPFVDIATNKNFAGSTIVPGYMQNLSPQLQADENTSNPAKWLGAQLGKSPKQIDYLVRSYTGVIGQLGIPALSEGGSMKETLIRQVTADPVYSNDIVSKFYDKKKELDTGSFDAKFTGGNAEPLEEKQRKLYGKISDTISDTRDQMRTIEKNPGLMDEAKKERLRGMQAAIVTMADIANRSEDEQMKLYNELKRKGKIVETKPVSPAKKAIDQRKEQKNYDEMTKTLMR